jgi:hypothetical protein
MISSDNVGKLIEIAKKVALGLFKMKDEFSDDASGKNGLIFPCKDRKRRISEQEARFLFAIELQKSGIVFSVETPTEKKYKFEDKAKSESSGSIDVTIYGIGNNSSIRSINVEFKAHTKFCSNDFEKLINEKEDGVIFHILNAVDTGTLICDKKSTKGVLSHYREDLKRLISNKKVIFNNDKKLTFFICSIKSEFLLYKEFVKDDWDKIDSFFKLGYKRIKGSAKLELTDPRGWKDIVKEEKDDLS